MRFCTTCGRSFEDDVEVCPHDGTPLFGSSSDDEAPSEGSDAPSPEESSPGQTGGGRREAEESERLKSSEGAGIVGEGDVASESAGTTPSALELLEEDDDDGSESVSADSTLDTDEMEELPLESDEPSGPNELEVHDDEGGPRATAMGMPGVGATEDAEDEDSDQREQEADEVGRAPDDEDLPDLGDPVGGPAPSPLDEPEPQPSSAGAEQEPEEVELDKGDQASDQIMAGIEDTLGEFDEDSQVDGPAAQPLDLEQDDIEVEPAPAEDDRAGSTEPGRGKPGDESQETGSRRGFLYAAAVILLSAAAFGYFTFVDADPWFAAGEQQPSDQPKVPVQQGGEPGGSPPADKAAMGAGREDTGVQEDATAGDAEVTAAEGHGETDQDEEDQPDRQPEATGAAAQPGGQGSAGDQRDPGGADSREPSPQPSADKEDDDEPTAPSAGESAPADGSDKSAADQTDSDQPESDKTDTEQAGSAQPEAERADTETEEPDPAESEEPASDGTDAKQPDSEQAGSEPSTEEGTGDDPQDSEKGSDEGDDSDSLEELENFDL